MRKVLSMVAIAGLCVTACSPHKVTHNPPPPIELPESYTAISESGANLPDRWWQDFGDQNLNRLVEQALEGNLEVRAAWERVTQAKMVAKQAGAARFPTLQVKGTLQETEPENPFLPISPVSFQAAWEVDIFRKAANSTAAARVNTAAARDQVESAAMSLVAHIVDSWFALVGQKARLALLEEQIKVSENFLELAEMRLGQGLGSSLDVLQQRQQLAVISGQRVPVESAIAVLTNQLVVLTGNVPGQIEIIISATLPELPPRPGAGFPADLLLRRPDVRAAQRQVEAADYGLATAVASRLPQLRLTGSYGPFTLIGNDYSRSTLWNVIANLVMPLFQGGRLKAEVKRNEAVVRERSYNFGQVLLQAILEVENAQVQESKQLEYLVELEGQYEIAQVTLEEARRRYSDGIGDQSFIQILSALSSQQQIEQSLLTAKQQALSYRVQLCRALGGSWMSELEARPKFKASANKKEAGEKQ